MGIDLPQLRRQRGAAAIGVGADHDEPQAMLVDTLANLMHWARVMGTRPAPGWKDPQPVDFEAALQTARMHFAEEQEE